MKKPHEVFKSMWLFFILIILLSGCSESQSRLEGKLSSYLQEDLKFMMAEVLKAGHPEALLDTPYYIIRDLRFFEGASAEIYSGYAEVDFFYYKNISMIQKRKYRYDVHYRQWDRYLKVWKFGDGSE